MAYPQFVLHTGTLFPWGAPNHDTVYKFAPVEDHCHYLISGRKGTESLSTVMVRKGGANVGRMHGAPLLDVDIADLPGGPSDEFEFMLSPSKPSDYAGAWFEMPSGATGLVSRHVTELPEQSDGTICVQRLDAGQASCFMKGDAARAHMDNLCGFVSELNSFLIAHMQKLRANCLNQLVSERFREQGGIAKQLYFQGAWEIEPDEALIIESAMPSKVGYWSVQLLDAFFAGIDPVCHFTAYNGRQVEPDSDGHVRFVVSLEDPGIANWLEPAGWKQGGMMWRWHDADHYPQPIVRKVPVAKLKDELPRDVSMLEPGQREVLRAARIRQYQSRRRL